MPKRKRTKTNPTRKRGKSKSFFSFLTPTHITLRRIAFPSTRSLLLISGVLLIGLGFYFKALTPSSLSFFGEVPMVSAEKTSSASPNQVKISSVDINLPIQQTNIINGKWEVGKDGVSHLATSANLGEEGNIILYGHNTAESLKNLEKTKIGHTIELSDSQGNVYRYKVYSIKIVTPDDISALLEYKKQTVTIYTCTGFADLKRLLIKAERVSNPLTI